MADFQDIGAEVGADCEEARFAGLASIAHEEFAEVVLVEHRDDTVFVDVIAGISENG
jgi:hypothetical protein